MSVRFRRRELVAIAIAIAVLVLVFVVNRPLCKVVWMEEDAMRLMQTR